MKCDGKKPYLSMANANRAARSSMKIGRVPYIRVYMCDACGAYHLTRSTAQQYEAKRKEYGR